MLPRMDTGRQGQGTYRTLAKRLSKLASHAEFQGRWQDATTLLAAALVLRDLANAPAPVDGQEPLPGLGAHLNV